MQGSTLMKTAWVGTTAVLGCYTASHISKINGLRGRKSQNAKIRGRIGEVGLGGAGFPGVSSRKLERASYDSVAFRFIAANDHPDHDTIAAFRRRFLKEIEGQFVEVLKLAREMGVLKMG